MQSTSLKLTLPLAVCGFMTAEAAWSAEAHLEVQLPRESPRPYVAVWLETASDKSFVGNVAVWYDTGKRGNRGRRWLPDLRQWWRKAGGIASLSMDGVTGATRAPGSHNINIGASRTVSALAPGTYELVVEAVREHGDYDLLRLHLAWPPTSAQVSTAGGKQELGTVRLKVTP